VVAERAVSHECLDDLDRGVTWMRGRGLLVEDCYIPVLRGGGIGFVLYENWFSTK
jgi:hypothetical protein